ncbi:MAG: deoxyribonuclease IV [Candidatus Bathyarchaeota archaeon]|nr:MAG: deoxyribonuclease IV [Candidatus Bathyarchaeota archaeon]
MRIGFHVSIKGSIDQAVDRAIAKGYTTFQIFTGNPRQWTPRKLASEEVEAFVEKVKTSDIDPVFAHMPYLPNLASPKEGGHAKSCATLNAELRRCSMLGIQNLVTHLGSHLGAGKRTGQKRIITAINQAFEDANEDVILLLENTAGGRNTVGDSFENIWSIMQGLTYPERVGICFDTSHAFAAGYDLRTFKSVEETIQKLDETVGIKKLKLVHLNDSKGNLNSRIDRHEHIGLGKIGENGFRNVLRSRLGKLPLILETPKDTRRSETENLRKVHELA